MKPHIVGSIMAMAALMGCGTSEDLADPLESWNDGATKQAIIQFVESVTDEASPAFVSPDERITVFDNDGTLWSGRLADAPVDGRWCRGKAPCPDSPHRRNA